MTKRYSYVSQAATSSRTDRTITISYRDLRSNYKPDRFCLNLWNMTMPDWIPEKLRADMVDALRGYGEEMALEIADNLIDCWTGLGLRMTGIEHVDEMLGRLYMRILSCAHEKGIKLLYEK